MPPPRNNSSAGGSTPAERKNQAVWDLINIDNYKQALQLCNRRLKKGEKGEYLLALKALILTSLGPDEALSLAQKLSTQTPPTASIEILKLLNTVWDELGSAHTQEAAEMWERSVKANPKDENMARDWFYSSIRSQNWISAQKAAMNLQKTFTRRREYYFWAIVASLLLHNSLPEDAMQRKLFGTLAYRMMDKARADTPEDTTVIPARAIQNSQEVNLLLEILPYVTPEGSRKQALSVLNSTNLGVDSKVGSGDWWGLARKRLDLLDESNDWDALFEACSTLLSSVVNSKPKDVDGPDGNVTGDAMGRGDDWRVWDGYVKATRKLYEQGKKEPSEIASKTILSRRDNAPAGGSRNVDLALVKLSSLFHNTETYPEGVPLLLEACKEYYNKIGAKNCCFEDLQSYLQMLNDVDQKAFLDYADSSVNELTEESNKAKIDKIVSRINHQKFVYLLQISPLSESSEENISLISSFVTMNTNVYLSGLSLGDSLLTTDDQYGDDAALLACMGLVRLHQLSDSSLRSHIPLYQAIAILEAVLSRSRHNYQALLLLTRLYLLIGAISPALGIYPRLNIKQIQNDTLSHYILTRISTLLPRSPLVPQLLEEATGIYESNSTQTPNMVQMAFDRGAYAQILSFLEFSRRVAGSVCRSMWDIELARLGHLSPGHSPSRSPLNDVGVNGLIYDNRDFEVVANCEQTGTLPFGNRLQLGPCPRDRWVRAFAKAENMLSFLDSPTTDSAIPPKDVDSTISQSLLPPSTAAEAGDKIEEEFTLVERNHLDVVRHISIVVSTISDKKTASLKALTDLFAVPTEETSPTNVNWLHLHALWTDVYSCIAARKLLTWLKQQKQTKPPTADKDAIATLTTAVENYYEQAIRKRARGLAASLDDEDTTQVLVDGVLDESGVGALLRKDEGVFGGVERIADIINRVKASIKEAVEMAGR